MTLVYAQEAYCDLYGGYAANLQELKPLGHKLVKRELEQPLASVGAALEDGAATDSKHKESAKVKRG